jgi:hypothetical protein
MEKNEEESCVPAIALAVSGLWLTLNSKGNILKDIAAEAASRAIYGKSNTSIQPQSNTSKSKAKKKKIHTNAKQRKAKAGAI